MPKAETLAKVLRELEEGKLGSARDRLHGLVTSFPEDFALREKLADVYFKLGYPVEAGRFWFFVESPSPTQQGAIDAFIKSCVNNNEVIAHRLKLGKELISEREAQSRSDFIARAMEEYKSRVSRGPTQPVATGIWDKVFLVGCAFLGFGLFIVFGEGLKTVGSWIWRKP